jgi:NitT/TauT family transport system substrate-binding protein
MLMSNGRQKVVILLAVVTLTSLCPSFVSESPSQETKLRVAYTSLAGSMVALWIGKEKGFFQDNGLDVDLVYTSTVTGVQALVSGSVEFSGAGCYNIMLARRGGANVTLLTNLLPYNPYLLVTQATIANADQLANKRVAISRLGDSTHFSALGALKELGVDPAAVTFVQVGSTAERLIALQTKSVDASLLGSAALARSKELGFNVIFNFHERKIPGCDSSIAVSEKFKSSSPMTTEAFLKGYFKGNAFFHAGPRSQVIAIMAKYMRGTTTETRITGAYESLRQRTSKQPGSMREAIASLLEWGSAVDKAWAKWRPEQFYDPSIVAKLKAEGFMERVYKEVNRSNSG